MGKRTLFFRVIIFIISSISLNLNGQTCDAGADVDADYSFCLENGIENVDLDSYLAAARSKIQNSKKVFGRRWVFKDGPNGPRGRRVARIRNEKTADFPNTGAGPEEEYAFYYIETDETCADTAVVNVCTDISTNFSFKEVEAYYCEGQPISNKDELLNLMPLDRMRDKDGYLKKEGETDSIPIIDYPFPLDEGAYKYNDYSFNKTDVLLYKVACSPNQIYFSFDNAQNTNDGINDYYEVDVMVHGDSSFGLGSGKLFFTYNNEAFGEYINAYEGVDISFPDGYILEQGVSNKFETFDNTNGDSTNRFSFNFIQYINNPDKNVNTTPAKLFHLKMKYLDISKPPMIAFESDGIYDDQFNIGTGFSINKITNDFFDNSGSALSINEDNLLADILVYPNPTNSFVNIKGNLNDVNNVSIYSISGKKLLELKNEFDKIDISNLQSGIYFLKITSGNSFKTFKVVKE
ncbi:T9SS type A sorting domain-containing protein [Sabulilitoribacter multivorans]|uniref:T9SS type A sorting domain-containing protein n=1 Tax=Flaviramulus multivorans TaxID=1304750 RepID=A0ABS9IMS8_9FLAO|nr:T9SS type A sorting domain-containing protein [Flaviramulus multivorans]MCF7561878.1 T9SS type A sorting domain-containing protein [Flaviramulus multivorans]